MPEIPTGLFYRSGKWEIWPDEGFLRLSRTRKADPKRLTPQQMSLLHYLLVHRERVVPKEEIFASIWHDAEVEEVALPRCISELRRVLGDDARRPEFIRTYPKRGYRWIAPIVEGVASGAPEAEWPDIEENVGVEREVRVAGADVGEAVAAGVGGHEIAAPDGDGPARRRPWLGFALAACLVALAIWAVRGLSGPPISGAERSVGVDSERAQASMVTRTPPPGLSVAVLDLVDLDPKPENVWLSSALAEMLASELARSEELSVIPRAAVANLQDELGLSLAAEPSMAGFRRIQEALSAEVLIGGIYLPQAPRLRIDLRIWRRGESVELESLVELGSGDDLAALVERAGERLRDRLGASVAGAGGRDDELHAKELYAKALARLGLEEAESAARLLQAANTLHPDDPLIFAALAEAWSLQGYQGRSIEAAEKAARLTAFLPPEERLWVESKAQSLQKNWPEAIARLRALRTLSPENPEYALLLVRILIDAGQGAEALEEASRGRDRYGLKDPRWPLAVADSHLLLGAFVAAVEAAAESIVLAEEIDAPRVRAAGFFRRALATHKLGEVETAMADLGRAEEIYRSAGDRRQLAAVDAMRGRWLATSGRLEKARNRLEAALEVFREIGDRANQARTLRSLGGVSLRLEDPQAARRRLEESFELTRDLAMPSELAAILNSRAIVEANLLNYADARALFEGSLEIYRELGNASAVAQKLQNLGRLLLLEARYGEAVERLYEAREVLEVVGTERSRALAALNIGTAKAIIGELPGAEEDLRAASRAFREVGDRVHLGRAQVALSEVLIDGARLDDAEAALEEAEQAFGDLNDASRLNSARNARALLELERGELDAAGELAQRSVEDEASRGTARLISLRLQVEVALRQGEMEAASTAFREAEESWRRDQIGETALSRLWLSLSELNLLAAEQRTTEARELAGTLLERTMKSGAELARAEVELALLSLAVAERGAVSVDFEIRDLATRARSRGWHLLAQKAEGLRGPL